MNIERKNYLYGTEKTKHHTEVYSLLKGLHLFQGISSEFTYTGSLRESIIFPFCFKNRSNSIWLYKEVQSYKIG